MNHDPSDKKAGENGLASNSKLAARDHHAARDILYPYYLYGVTRPNIVSVDLEMYDNPRRQ